MRIGIVNDRVMAVEAMRRVLRAAGEHEVAWVALDGVEAVARCARDRPDLILMDLIMPRMDGVEATRRIMAESPCAIVVVTASVADHASRVFEAMGAGALDAVNTPVLGPNPQPSALNAQPDARGLLAKVETIRRLLGVEPGPKSLVLGPQSGSRWARIPDSGFGTQDSRLGTDRSLVVIGASAGGPAALARILGGLPVGFPAAIVIVQHVDAQFAPGLAEWLREHTGLGVRLAAEGDRPVAGVAMLAGGEEHLVLRADGRLGYTPHPAGASYVPSVDVFFKSVGPHWPGAVIGVLLTGMGRDGAEGLKVLRDRGCRTIVQDQATSAVYGMPKAAAELNAGGEILGLDKIARRLTNMIPSKVPGLKSER